MSSHGWLGHLSFHMVNKIVLKVAVSVPDLVSSFQSAVKKLCSKLRVFT